MGFLNVGFRLYFKGCTFPNSQLICKCYSSWTSPIFQIHEIDEILGFLNVSLGCTFKFIPTHQKVGKPEFLNFAYFHILSDCAVSFSRFVSV